MMLWASQGVILHTYLWVVARFHSAPLPSFHSHAGEFRISILVYLKAIPRIFACVGYVLLVLSMFFTHSLFLSPAFYIDFLRSFWVVSGSSIGLL